MAGGPVNREIDGQYPGWTGPCRTTVGAITKSDATLYDPPLRRLYIGGAGNVVVVLDADDEAVSANYTVLAVAAAQILDGFAIRQVRSTNTTATGIIGFR